MNNLRFVVVDDAVFMRTLLKKMIEEVEGSVRKTSPFGAVTRAAV